MPPLDHATLQAVLDKQGMPNTTENLNRIAQFAAVAPDMLEKYLGRGTDQARVDAGAGTDAAIDRSIASTADPRLAQLAGPNPYSATIDPNTGLTNIGPGLVKTPEPTGGGRGGPAKPPGIPGDYNAPVGAPPFSKQAATPGGITHESEMNNPAVNPAVIPTHTADTRPEGSSWTNYIVPSILGLFAANAMRRGEGGAAVRGAANAAPTPPISAAIPNAPPVAAAQPHVAPAPINPDAVRPNVQAPVAGSPAVPVAEPGRASPAGRPSGQSQADIDRMRAEVAAENARGEAALRNSIKTKAQIEAEATAAAARNATGRK